MSELPEKIRDEFKRDIDTCLNMISEQVNVWDIRKKVQEYLEKYEKLDDDAATCFEVALWMRDAEIEFEEEKGRVLDEIYAYMDANPGVF